MPPLYYILYARNIIGGLKDRENTVKSTRFRPILCFSALRLPILEKNFYFFEKIL